MATASERRSALRAEYEAKIAEAALRQDRVLDESFCLHNDYIAGIEVRPFSLHDLNMLVASGNPIVRCKTPEPEDILNFLWYLSPQFKPSRWRKWLFARSIRHHRYLDLAQACIEYVKDAYYLSPLESITRNATQAAKQDDNQLKVSYMADLVHSLVGHGYGTERDIMLMPLRRVWQYRRLIIAEIKAKSGHAPYIMGGEVDRLWAEYMDKHNAIRD